MTCFLRCRFLILLIAIPFIPGAAARAQDTPGGHDKPAVDGWNGKISLEGGFGDPLARERGVFGTGYAIGSLSAPIGHRFGVQVDAVIGSIDGLF